MLSSLRHAWLRLALEPVLMPCLPRLEPGAPLACAVRIGCRGGGQRRSWKEKNPRQDDACP